MPPFKPTEAVLRPLRWADAADAIACCPGSQTQSRSVGKAALWSGEKKTKLEKCGRAIRFRFMLKPEVVASGGIECKMHELSIMQSALEEALKQARQAGARQVREIRLRVGALSGVVPEALQMAFEALRDGTEAAQAVLKIEDVPARFWCVVCDREFVSQKLYAECPKCRCVSGELRAGRELELASLEVS